MSVNKLILGTVQFGLNYGINNDNGKVDETSVTSILNHAYLNGINTLDTADAYGNATDRIGNYHRQSDYEFRVITKFKSGHSEIDAIKNVVQENLKRLEIPQVFGYLYHSFNDFKKYSGTLKELEELKKEGYIKHIGVSIYTNEQFEELLEYDAVEIIQLPYNLLDNANKRASLIKRAKDLGKIIHVRSVFLQGLFFKELETLPATLLPLKEDLQIIKDVVKNNKISMAELALNYVMSNPNIDGILVGVDSLEQLKMNIKAIEEPLPIAIKEAIDAISVQNIALLNPSNWS
jgi:aryl-alcohol dehydrogenase-like predicted oxidoreductase